MPIYEFICRDCGHEKELFLKTNSDDIVCDKCGALMKKFISKSNFVLKGGGWYNEGYNKKKD